MVLDEAEGWTEPAGSFGSVRSVEVGGSVVLASRISYVGEFGWELHVPSDQAGQLWDRLWAAGQPAGLVPVGIGVYGTTARLEKGYRAFGAELTPEYNLVEAGMTRPRVKAEPFIGKEAYLAQRSAAPAAVLATLTVDSPISADGTPRYAQGGEPILAPDGTRLLDALGRPSYVTSAGSGPSVGKHLLLAYLPPSASAVGTNLLVEYLGEQYPVTVASHGAVFDPSGSRMRGDAHPAPVENRDLTGRGHLAGGRPPVPPDASPVENRDLTGRRHLAGGRPPVPPDAAPVENRDLTGPA
jgi:glycine cleavage system aminomethyltransferase T